MLISHAYNSHAHAHALDRYTDQVRKVIKQCYEEVRGIPLKQCYEEVREIPVKLLFCVKQLLKTCHLG